jgi:hypothetical protein
MMAFVWVLLLGGILTSPLLAQQSSIPAHARVRIRHAGTRNWTTATFTRRDADSLYLDTASGEAAFARSGITEMDVSRGMRRRTLSGALYGGLILGGIGAGLGALAAATDETEDGDLGAEAAFVGAGLGVVAGGLLGAGIGALIKTERWETVDPKSLQLSLIFTPSPSGLRAGLSASF